MEQELKNAISRAEKRYDDANARGATVEQLQPYVVNITECAIALREFRSSQQSSAPGN